MLRLLSAFNFNSLDLGMLISRVFYCTAFLLTLSLNSKAQDYKAGDILAGYVDVAPDTLINYVFPPASSSESYYFDMNHDSLNDFVINARALNANGQGDDYIIVKSLNPNLYIRFGRIDSLLGNDNLNWYVSKVAKPLMYGDSINALDSKWDSTALFLTENSFQYGFYGFGKNILDWATGTDLFIGVKFQNTTSTLYGWVRVSIPFANNFVKNCYIKDYSFSGPYVGIADVIKNSIKIYPNPTSNTLHIYDQNNENEYSTLEITNYLGQTILNQDYSNMVNVSNLSVGIYTLKISARDKQTICYKFIKE